MDQVLAFFGEPPTCVFCGSPDVARWDHLVPVNLGGDTVVGNMVPACQRCDDSRQDNPFDAWMVSNAQHSPKTRGTSDLDERITRLRAYAEHFGYKTRPVEERCRPTELPRLEDLRSRAAALRKEIEEFIRDFNEVRQKR
ncbi:MAG: HNH endonuclease [bacterium]